ncbi:MAG: thioredoxin [Acidimicrobiales bacterium]|nr:thioredoxin [Acidimicrobiales bacterium]
MSQSSTTAGTATVIVCRHCGKKNRVPPAGPSAPRCGNCHNPLPWIVDADDLTFYEIVDASAIPVLVDLWAPWCGPCKMVSPALENLAAEFAGRIKLAKVNVDRSPAVGARFEVRGIPTLLLMRGGAVVARQTGAAPEAALRAWLEQALVESEPK